MTILPVGSHLTRPKQQSSSWLVAVGVDLEPTRMSKLTPRGWGAFQSVAVVVEGLTLS